MDTFEKLGAIAYAAFIAACITFVSIGLFNLAQPKEFDGYYLHTWSGKHRIYINWDNRIDEMAYQTYDGEEVLRVYERLTLLDAPPNL